MNQRLEDYLRRYRDRFGAAGCRADGSSDEHILRCVRSVMVYHGRRVIRIALNQVWFRRAAARAGLTTTAPNATITIGGTSLPVSSWTFNPRGTPVAEIARLREGIRRARPRISVADASGTVRWTHNVEPPPVPKKDYRLGGRSLAEWLRNRQGG